MELVSNSYMTGRCAATMQKWVRLGVVIVGRHARSVMMTREKDGKVSFRPTLCTVKQGTG